MATPHIECEEKDVAKIVIMPGDPKRAKLIAENYLDDYELVSNVRSMNAYTGHYKGKRISIFPSGMGNPSMGIYSHELFNDYNVDVIIRVGTMGSYLEELKTFDIALATSAYSMSNYALELCDIKDDVMPANKELIKAVKVKASELGMNLKEGRVHSTEAFYSKLDYKIFLEKHNSVGVDMETFALYTNAKVNNKKAISILTVSDHFVTKERISAEERERNLGKTISLALEVAASL